MESSYSFSTSSYSGTEALDPAAAAALLGVMMFMWGIIAILVIITIISQWKLFTKAGKPGWAAIVPIYNSIVLLEIVGRPAWWVILYFVPFANLVVAIMVALDTAKAYGKDTTFGILMILFPIPMYPILAFSKTTQYVGPVAATQPQYGPVPPTQPPVVPTQPQ